MQEHNDGHSYGAFDRTQRGRGGPHQGAVQQYVDCCHEITDTSYLVQTKELTQEVAIRAGIKGEDRVEDTFGVVFRLNGAYAGFAARSLWEWLGQAEETE